MSAAAVLTGYVADRAFGDPRRGHPVAGFGRLALAAEERVYAPDRMRGALFAGALVLGSAAAAELAARRSDRRAVLAVTLWAALGGRSLAGEATRIARLVERGDLDGARRELPALVGRDPGALDAAGICRALVESVAENTGDAVVGALVWGAVAGPAGVVAFRAANTLDAMVGHRIQRYAEFGWAAARLDDVLGRPASIAGTLLTALCAPLAGGMPGAAWRTARSDGGAHPSPNAGPLEAAFAGALGVRLGGPLRYGDRHEQRPVLGATGCEPEPADVYRAAALSLAVGITAAMSCAALRAAIGKARR